MHLFYISREGQEDVINLEYLYHAYVREEQLILMFNSPHEGGIPSSDWGKDKIVLDLEEMYAKRLWNYLKGITVNYGRADRPEARLMFSASKPLEGS